MERDLPGTLLHVVRRHLTRDYPGQIEACLDLLGDEDLWWRPHERSNAVGNLVLHLAGSNRYYMEQAIAGRPVARDRAAEFAAREGMGKAGLLEIWSVTRRVTEEVLGALTPGELMRPVEANGKASTCAQILLHVSHHNAAHMGQIVWITKLRRPGALDELWMKME